MTKLRIVTLLKSMGATYIGFRLWHEIFRRSGLMKWMYPVASVKIPVASAEEILQRTGRFLPMSSGLTPYTDEEKEKLREDYQQLRNGFNRYFSGLTFKVNQSDWLTNPINGYSYRANIHWTEIKDIDPLAGDIKFVWERARFSWVYSCLKADMVLGTDSLRFLIDEILSFIRHAPVNCGPHWRCSQEIALRVLNWINILFRYRDRLTKELSNDELLSIITSIHDQIRHVFSNRKFARIAVRNNHAITEALGLYVVGTVFPFFREARKWRRDGKRTLEKEGLYQIYDDGAYIQHSFNYQRVVVQEFTFALEIARANDDRFSEDLHERLRKMLRFMLTMQDSTTGKLPNYGANDGALFFPVGRGSYHDFRPQLNALSCALDRKHCYAEGFWRDESCWFSEVSDETVPFVKNGIQEFAQGGYYCLRSQDAFVMLRCANYKHRPAQADQLHIDIWHKGQNVIRDCGSYTYDMSDPKFTFFAGTSSHNTVMLNNSDQMQRGPRFIWYNWPERVGVKLIDADTHLFFEGCAVVYKGIVGNGVVHNRSVRLNVKLFHIEIIDTIVPEVENSEQIWNIEEAFMDDYTLQSFDKNDTPVGGDVTKSYISELYGIYKDAHQIRIPLHGGYIRTVVTLKKIL